jgi:hypothetical protein
MFMFVNIDQLYAKESSNCDRETFSLLDCPRSSSGDGESDNDDANIERRIASVIPFP